ncbi:MAG: sporulation protein YabP [Eubacteriales bacterium]
MLKEDEVKRISDKSHKVTIDSRERANVTGVLDVDSFNENEIIFITTCGAITINGEDLHINRLNLEEGQLIIDGVIQSLDYSDHEERRNRGFFSKVFR